MPIISVEIMETIYQREIQKTIKDREEQEGQKLWPKGES